MKNRPCPLRADGLTASMPRGRRTPFKVQSSKFKVRCSVFGVGRSASVSIISLNGVPRWRPIDLTQNFSTLMPPSPHRSGRDPEASVSCVVPFLDTRLTTRSLAPLLRPFGVNARPLPVPCRPVRGYDLSDFTHTLAANPLPKV